MAVFLVPWEISAKQEIGDSFFFPEIYAKQSVGTFYENQTNSCNKRKIGYKFTKKLVRNKNGAHCCHAIAVAVLRVHPKIWKKV